MPVQVPNPVITAGPSSTTTELSLEKGPPRTRLALMLGLFVVAAILLFWRQLHMMESLWISDGALSIGALVPFVSAYFGWRAWRASDRIPVRPAITGFALASGIALAVIALNFQARNGVTLCLLMMPAFLAGCVASVAGWKFTRLFLFSLAFLVFLVPVPPPVLGLIDYPLQLLCAKFLEGMAHVLHLPVVRNGVEVGPNAVTRVAVGPPCNGVRSSVTLVMLTIVLAKLKTLRLGPAALLTVAALPLAYAANFLRLSGLFLLMTIFGERFMPYEHYTDLTTGGVWFFFTALVMASVAQRVARSASRESVL